MVLYVQFSDEKEEKIITWFASPQSSECFDFLGEVDPSDSRYRAFYDSLPSYASDGMPDPDPEHSE